MEKQSLAEFLGVADPLDADASKKLSEQSHDAGMPDPSADMPDAEFCKGVLASPQYRESILRRVLTDSLPPAVEAMIWDRAHGRVAQRVEHSGKDGKPIEHTQRVVVFRIPDNDRESDVIDGETIPHPAELPPQRTH